MKVMVSYWKSECGLFMVLHFFLTKILKHTSEFILCFVNKTDKKSAGEGI